MNPLAMGREGLLSGYPFDKHEFDDDYLEYLNSHHDCCICRDRDIPEDLLYRTTFGWMHIDCYNAIILNATEDGSETPELI